MKISALVNRFSLFVFVLCVVLSAVLSASAQSLPRVFQLDAKVLAAQKAHPDPELLKLAQEEANKALKLAPMSVTEKKQVPPSGDKHDYLSMGDYWWPNPDTPNHLPYIRKDGQHNPETYEISDKRFIVSVSNSSDSLALAYYLTGDEKYAEHAALLLRVFFLDAATAMHPNLNFAQYIDGVNTGRGAGIIDVRMLPRVLDAVGMLAGSKAWTAADDVGIHRWFSEYYRWLTTAKEALKEKATPNNHGSWFAEQEAPIAMYLGKNDDAKTIAQQIREQRIPSQFDAQGMQKYELVRTNSFSYSAFNLEALTAVAEVVAPLGEDLYKPVKPGAPGILTGIDALLPYDAQHPWPHEQITSGMEGSLCPALVRASAHTHDAKYAEAQKRFACKATAVTMLEAMSSR